MVFKIVVFVIWLYIHLIYCQNETKKEDAPKTAPEDPDDMFTKHTWAGNWDSDRTILAKWLLTGLLPNQDNTETKPRLSPEYPGYDGWYNNPARPDSGAIDRPLLRRWPAAYEDGAYKPSGFDRPNPMTLSEELLKLEAVGTKSKQGKTAFLVFFGQQLVEEVLDSQRPACPPEYFNIDIPKNHNLRKDTGHSKLPLLRTRYDMRTGFSPNNPRQQLNEITPYFDGGLVYGTSKAWADYLRLQENGKIAPNGLLASTEDGLFPARNIQRLPMANPPPPFYHSEYIAKHELANVKRFFKLGNPRGNENTFLLSFGILLFRWHNYIATNLKKLYPQLPDEEIFDETRKWVIATHQHIVVNTWLPVWLGVGLPPYSAYNADIDPQIDQFFQAVAMRFGHTLVVSGVHLRDYGRNNCSTNFKKQIHTNAIRTCNAYWRPQEVITASYEPDGKKKIDIDRVLMGMASQLCEEEDHKIVEDLRGNVFGPLEFSRRDLMAINIQRARDHGLPDYNTARKIFGLPPIELKDIDTAFSHVDQKIRDKLKELHNNDMSKIDPWVGGILETKDGPGELFTAIIKDQFRRIRDGDRFWFENEQNELFTKDEIARIKKLTIYDIVMATTEMDSNDIPKNPFTAFTSKAANDLHPNCISTISEQSPSLSNKMYFHLPSLNAERLDENCTTAGTYDYFTYSELSYIITFSSIGIFIIGAIVLVYTLSKIQSSKSIAEKNIFQREVRETFHSNGRRNPYFLVRECTSKKTSVSVVVTMDVAKKQIQVNTPRGLIIRAIDFNYLTQIDNNAYGVDDAHMKIWLINDKIHLLIRMMHEYDLILKFESDFLRENFLTELENFISGVGIKRERMNYSLKGMFKMAVTKEDRQKKLDSFFRVVFAQAFKLVHTEEEIYKMDSESAKDVIYTEITISEFADALSMKKDSEFVRKIFYLIDKDRNGFVSFREFLDLLSIFTKGDPKEKAKLLFDMYDINNTGYLTEKDFVHMIRSLMETCSATVREEDLEKTIQDLKLNVVSHKAGLNFENFYKLFEHDIKKLENINKCGIFFPNVPGKRMTYLEEACNTVESLYSDRQELTERIQGEIDNTTTVIDEEQEKIIQNNPQVNPNRLFRLSRTIEKNLREIFWVTLFTLVVLSIFAERAYYYSVEREHSGLRRIAGYGVTITRGAASAQMFTYSVLLLTMCRNTLTVLRETFLNVYIPFDRSVEMHKFIACWALLFTVLHVIGHAFNFYHISTQPADDLTCLFRNYFHATHELPKFHYWCYETMTGITGVILTLITIVIYVCSLPGVSRYIFWRGHMLYILFYIFMILHGSGRLIQAPYFLYFFMGPVILFIIDSVISASRRKIQIRVLTADRLPSDVTKLEFQRPNNFEYKSGQWVRIACRAPKINASEYHPFTLSSSPNETNLTVHIRAVGPWTKTIRKIYDPNARTPLPKIYLDGPYGEGHQDWYRYDVSVLVGGGIGVTPFASILKDIVFRANKAHRVTCKKIYFIWVTKTQRQFEWLVDIIRDVEFSDSTNTVSTHLFITQFYHKFDLRTILVYLCERHFQKVSGGRSLVTGLKAVTHFGRPNFPQFFKSLQTIHSDVNNIGVFSCGPPPMTASVDKACLEINKLSNVTFEHHYKNF